MGRHGWPWRFWVENKSKYFLFNQGYVKLSISVLGPGDKVYIHPPDDIEDGDNLLMPNSAKQDPLNIEISIYRA